MTKTLIIFLSIFLAVTTLRAQIINTIAGTEIPGYTGDGDSAVNAQLWNPNAVAVDDSGNVFIADWGATCIRKIAPSGIISTIANNKNSKMLLTGNIHGIAADHSGGLYYAQYLKSMIGRISLNNEMNVIAGEGKADYSTDVVQGTIAQIVNPENVAVDGWGNVYVSDEFYSVVRRIAPGGKMTIIAGKGIKGYSGDGGDATNALLNGPKGLAADNGDLYIADAGNHVVRKIDVSGIITTVAGNGNSGNTGDNGLAVYGRLADPEGVAVDRSGTLYIADEASDVVRMVSPAGIINTIAGNGTTGYSGDTAYAPASQLNSPHDVAVDAYGDLYIADMGNHVVRKVSMRQAVKKPQVVVVADTVTNHTFHISADASRDEITIKTNEAYYTSFTISNFNNEVLISDAITDRETVVDVSTLKPGSYYVTLKKDAVSKTLMFVKAGDK